MNPKISFRIPINLLERLQMIAKSLNKTLSQIIREALELFVEKILKEKLKPSLELNKFQKEAFTILNLIETYLGTKGRTFKVYLSYSDLLGLYFTNYSKAFNSSSLACILLRRFGKIEAIPEKHIVEIKIPHSSRDYLSKEGIFIHFPEGITKREFSKAKERIRKGLLKGLIC